MSAGEYQALMEEIRGLRKEFTDEIQTTRHEFKAELQAARQELRSEIREVKTSIQAVDTRMTKVEARCGEHREKTKDLADDIWGNGKLGIKMEVAKIKQQHRMAMAVVGGVLTLLGGIAGALVQAYLK